MKLLPPADTVASSLGAAARLGLERLDAQWLLGSVLGQPRAWLIAHDADALAAADAERFAQLCRRRAAGEPLAYILGEREFHGLRLHVSPAVLDPRPDTETLVDWALELLAARPKNAPAAAVIDLGTGSGAVALAIQHRRPGVRVTATDLCPDALAVAQANGRHLGAEVDFVAGSWWQPVAGLRFDLAVSNPPYIADGDPHLAALTHEPRMALTPGGDGLDAIRDIVAGAPAHLSDQGWLLIEHGWTQADAVAGLLRETGFEPPTTRLDLAGRPRCTGARWPGA
jgi:release factor glutamine methyltransferase